LGDVPAQVISKSERGKRDYFELGLRQWKEKLSSGRKIDQTLLPWLKWSKKQRIDMVVVDDLALVRPKLSSEVHPAYHLNEANKLLRKWCNRMGAFLVAGAPLGYEYVPPEMTEQWNQLDTHVELKMVRVRSGPDLEGMPTYDLAWKSGASEIVIEPNIPEKVLKHV